MAANYVETGTGTSLRRWRSSNRVEGSDSRRFLTVHRTERSPRVFIGVRNSWRDPSQVGGRVTGWIAGMVQGTCVDYNPPTYTGKSSVGTKQPIYSDEDDSASPEVGYGRWTR